MGALDEVRVTSGGWPESPALVGEWDALAERVSSSPFVRPGWFRAWYEAFEPGRRLVLLAHRGERLVGVLPLIERRGIVASATNGHTPHFAPLAEDGTVLEALLDAALKRARRRLELNFLAADDPAVGVLSGRTAGGGRRMLERSYARSPYIELDGTWEDLEASLPSKRRSDMRRRGRRIEAEGAIEFEDVTTADRLADLLREGWAVEASGWKGSEGTAVAADPSTSLFYERVAEWAAERHLLRLSFMRLDGRALAFAFCFADSRSLYVLKIGFDPGYAKFAPGVLLTRHMLMGAFAADLDTYEFLGDDDPYKLVWTDRTRDMRLIQAFPSTPAGLAEHLAWQRGRPLIKRLLRR